MMKINRINQGFLLIEMMMSLAILTALAAIISFYGSMLSSRYQEAKNYLDALTIAQNSLYTNQMSTMLKIDCKHRELRPIAQSLKAKGYTDAFRNKLIVRESAISFPISSKQNKQSIILKTIVNKEIF